MKLSSSHGDSLVQDSSGWAPQHLDSHSQRKSITGNHGICAHASAQFAQGAPSHTGERRARSTVSQSLERHSEGRAHHGASSTLSSRKPLRCLNSQRREHLQTVESGMLSVFPSPSQGGCSFCLPFGSIAPTARSPRDAVTGSTALRDALSVAQCTRLGPKPPAQKHSEGRLCRASPQGEVRRRGRTARSRGHSSSGAHNGKRAQAAVLHQSPRLAGQRRPSNDRRRGRVRTPREAQRRFRGVPAARARGAAPQPAPPLPHASRRAAEGGWRRGRGAASGPRGERGYDRIRAAGHSPPDAR